MKSRMLTLMLAWIGICGCAGRMNVDLLQARIRQQAALLSESQREIEKTQAELKQSRLESERLKSEIALSNLPSDETSVSVEVQKVKINALASGGLNKDEFPGDDMVVVQFVPVDSENQPAKVPGDLEIILSDPQLPAPQRELGRWSFTSEECLDRWTRGVTSSGFQLNLPLQQFPVHSDLIVHLQYTTQDSQRLITSQKIKVAVVPANVVQQINRQQKKRIQVVDDSDELLPAVGDFRSNEPADGRSDWDQEAQVKKPVTTGRTILHSSNWTDATIPQMR